MAVTGAGLLSCADSSDGGEPEADAAESRATVPFASMEDPSFTLDVETVRRNFYLHHDAEGACIYLLSDDPEVEGIRYRAFLPVGWRVALDPLEILRGDGSVYAAAGDRIVTPDHGSDRASVNASHRCDSTYDLWLGDGSRVFLEGTTETRPRG